MREFPIHRHSIQDMTWMPKSVPWDRLPEHAERRAQRNHSQTLARLAERGGLSPEELWCVYHDTDYGAIRRMSPRERLQCFELVVFLNEAPEAQPIYSAVVTPAPMGGWFYHLNGGPLRADEAGLMLCDLVRHTAKALKADEETIFEWLDRERRHPTSPVIQVKPS